MRGGKNFQESFTKLIHPFVLD